MFVRGFCIAEPIKVAPQVTTPVLYLKGQVFFMRRTRRRQPRTFGGEAARFSTAKLVPAKRDAPGGAQTGGNAAKKGLRNMEQQIKREVATQTAAAGKAAAPRKRDVAAAPKKAGLTTQDLILIAVLLAAGAVLKLTVGSLLSSMGMKPNFIIAMYCLAIILTRPKLGQALIIGLLAGLICQIPLLNATPLLNIPSEILGALACGLLIKVPMSIGGKLDLNPLVNTFISTVVSGGTFALLSVYINVVSTGGDVMVALATYAAIVLGTATFNCILVQVLAMPLKKVLKR